MTGGSSDAPREWMYPGAGMDPARTDPLRLLFACFGALGAIALALVVWAGRDTNEPRLVVEPEPEGIPRIEVEQPWSFAPGGGTATTRTAEAAIDLVDGGTGFTEAERVAVGSYATWDEAIDVVDVTDERTIEAARLAHIGTDGVRTVLELGDAIEPELLGRWDLLVVDADGYLPRLFEVRALLSADEEDRRVHLTPPVTVRIEYDESLRWPTTLKSVRVRSMIAGRAQGMGGAGDFAQFRANFRSLVDPSLDADERSRLLKPLRRTPWFKPVTQPGEGGTEAFARCAATLPFGVVEIGPGSPPVAIEGFGTPGSVDVQLVASSPVRVGVDGQFFGSDAHEAVARVGGHCMPGGTMVLTVRTTAHGSYSAFLPFGARDARVLAWDFADDAHETVIGGTAPSVDERTGEVRQEGTLPGHKRLSARWTEPNGDLVFSANHFEVLPGGHVALGTLGASPVTELLVEPRIVDPSGRPIDAIQGLLDTGHVSLRIPEVTGRTGFVLFGLDLPLSGRVPLVRGLPEGQYTLDVVHLVLPPALTGRWDLVPPTEPTVVEVTGGSVRVELPIVVRARADLTVTVPLEGSLYAPGINYAGVALNTQTEEVVPVLFRWVDAMSHSVANVPLTGGTWDVVVAARTPADHPNHPGEVWYAERRVTLADFAAQEVTLDVAPGAAARMSDEGAEPLPLSVATVPTHAGLKTLEHTKGAFVWDGSQYLAGGLAPGTEYALRLPNGRSIQFTTGASGSVVEVVR